MPKQPLTPAQKKRAAKRILAAKINAMFLKAANPGIPLTERLALWDRANRLAKKHSYHGLPTNAPANEDKTPPRCTRLHIRINDN